MSQFPYLVYTTINNSSLLHWLFNLSQSTNMPTMSQYVYVSSDTEANPHSESESDTYSTASGISATLFWFSPRVEDSDNNSDDDTEADLAFEEQERLHFLREASIFAAWEEKSDPDWKPCWKWKASISKEESDGKGADKILILWEVFDRHSSRQVSSICNRPGHS